MFRNLALTLMLIGLSPLGLTANNNQTTDHTTETTATSKTVAKPALGGTLENVTLNRLGELKVTDDDEVEFVPFYSSQLKGRRYVLQYLSPRPGIAKQNVPMSEAIEAVEPEGSCRTVNIINMNEALWGTKMIVKSGMKGGKKRNLACQVIADAEGKAQQLWGLKPKTNHTFVIDEQGKIIFYHAGRISPEQTQQIIQLSTSQATPLSTQLSTPPSAEKATALDSEPENAQPGD